MTIIARMANMSYHNEKNYGEALMKRRLLLGSLLIIGVLALSTILFVVLTEKPADSKLVYYTYSIVNTYPHDENAFTQGLVYENGSLYESTGLYGSSTLRRVKLENGEILQRHTLSDRYFGEGITILDDKIIQLTWNEHKGFIYDKHSFDLLQEFSYSTDGWGITYDGNRLIMSNGSATLIFLDSETFEKVGQVEVHDTAPVTQINELEYINGKVYANIWKEEKIAIINPQTGQVEGWIDLSGIQDLENQDVDNVLNGIAYDAEGNRLFVTGKMWPHLFEIKLIPRE
jgi:glutamine cyclotransferase